MPLCLVFQPPSYECNFTLPAGSYQCWLIWAYDLFLCCGNVTDVRLYLWQHCIWPNQIQHCPNIATMSCIIWKLMVLRILDTVALICDNISNIVEIEIKLAFIRVNIWQTLQTTYIHNLLLWKYKCHVGCHRKYLHACTNKKHRLEFSIYMEFVINTDKSQCMQ